MIQRLTPEAKLPQPIEPRPTPPGCMATPAGSIHPFAPWSPFSFGDLYVLSPFASMTSCTRVWRVTHTFYERLQPLGIAGLVDLSDEIFGRPPRGAVLRGLDRVQEPDVEDVEVRAVRWLADDPDAPTVSSIHDIWVVVDVRGGVVVLCPYVSYAFVQTAMHAVLRESPAPAAWPCTVPSSPTRTSFR